MTQPAVANRRFRWKGGVSTAAPVAAVPDE